MTAHIPYSKEIKNEFNQYYPGSATGEKKGTVKKMEKKANEFDDTPQVKSLVIVFSYHHNNTEKIAKTCAKVLGAEVKTPQQVKPEEIAEYDLVGFGSGIYSATFDPSVLDLADRLPNTAGKKAFLFSTYGAPAFIANREFIEKNHRQIREKLQAKGYMIIGEFGCAGWNTNSFLKYFGGLNKGRPNAEDLRNAEEFARSVKGKARG
jgi:flavodoxin